MLLTSSIGRSPSLVTGASSSSSSLTPRLKRDVFLSFCGKDTRHNFTDHLFTALKGNVIEVFRDEEGLERGTFIDLELTKAIKESKIAIVVLSESYASSKWCLNELAQIIACIEETGMIVIPVFYHVEPSNVGKQNGTFGSAFAKHNEDSGVTSEEIQTWKNALICVSKIAGYPVEVSTYESKVIQDIRGNVHRKLSEQGIPSLKTVLSICTVPTPSDFTVGQDVPLKMLKTLLLKEEKQQILLTAPGGCGKTELLKRLGHDLEIKGKFEDNIFFVPVSKTLNPMVIVQRLFLHICNQDPEFQSDEDAINQLHVLLTQISGPKLLILDDVCPGSEFRLEKFKFDIPNFNILVTSRTTLPKSSVTYYLEPLNDEDATILLRYSASLPDGNSRIPDGVIKKIVRRCGGFPLALEVIGKSLHEKPVEAWRSIARKWSNGLSIFNSSSDLLHCLQKSLEFPADKVILKECFMDLGSFAESKRIDVPSLIDIWAVLHELDEDGTIAYLHELAARNLVTLVTTRKESKDTSENNNYPTSYNEDFVIQHDILRELAIYVSNQEPIGQRKRLIMDINKNIPPNWYTKEDQHVINARLLSISTDELFSSRWCDIQAPKVEVLILNLQTQNYSLPDFMFKMDKLVVLMINNYGYFPAELSNFQLLKSLPNLETIKLTKVSIPSLCKAPVLLKSLKKISLVMCNIGQASQNFTIQVSDALPNLREINIDYCNDLVELPAGLCDVICLKKLSITNCHKLSALPNGIGKLVNLEVLRLGSCTDLSELPESIRSFHKLCILDISDCLGIRHLPKDIGELCNLKELHMKGCLSLRKGLPPSTTNLEQLKLVICDEERATFWEPIKEVLTNLEVKVAEKDINLTWLLRP